MADTVRTWQVVAKRRVQTAAALVAYAAKRFRDDRCTRVAASLSYTTLLAIVPLIAVGFAIFSAFPAFEELQTKVQTFLFSNLVPELGEVIAEQIQSFVQNTAELSAVGLFMLIVSALLMFATVENAFNIIWRVGENRAITTRLMIFWAILTLGPLLMGASVVLSSYIFTLTRVLDVEAFTGPLGRLVRVVPLVLEIATFALFYKIIPNTRVTWRHALTGGVVAGLFFEGLKRGFAVYVAGVPAQQTIYGALSTIPLFLVWMYICWVAVLIGAEIAASLPEYRRSPEDRLGEEVPRSQRLTIALGILACLAEAARTGGGPVAAQTLRPRIGVEEESLAFVLRRLSETHYVAATAEERWLLARDLRETTLYDLFRDLGLDVSLETVADEQAPAWMWAPAELMARMGESQRDILSAPLAGLLRRDEHAAEEEPTVREMRPAGTAGS